MCPPALGTELEYVKQAIDAHKICGDGAFTKMCNNWMEERFHTQKVLLTTSGTTALDMAMLLCGLQPGDEVILPSFTFSSTATAAVLAGARLVFVDVRPDTMNIDETKIEAAITDKTKVFMLNSPSNPTGMVYTKAELEAIAEVCCRHNIYVIADEIYCNLVYDNNEFVSFASLGEDVKERTILVNGVSKSYAMTGWRIGYVAGPRVEICAMTSFQSHATSNANSIAQYAAMKALQGDPQCVTDMVAQFEARRNAMVEKINSIPGVSCMKPQGAFYIMLNITGVMGKTYNGRVIDSSQTFAELLLADKHVAVVPGNAFEAEGFCRLSYAVAMESCMEGLRRIEEFVSELK